jgi:putative transposase
MGNCGAAQSMNSSLMRRMRTSSACFKLEENRDNLVLGWRSASSAAIKSHAERLQPQRCFMAAPPRGNTGLSVYFITASTFQRQSLFQSERMAQLFIGVLKHYRRQQKYLLHEFVLMPNHFHLLITPALTLERAIQLIKGGFSYRAKRELGFTGEIWQPSFYDRRVRDIAEYQAFREYIHLNPVKKGLVSATGEWPYSSERPDLVMDGPPQRLKPASLTA